ncbi:MAG: hypothetical protein GY862_35475 [Gammaproteobacteria bacterium]|nr:hypothetical protein [Gammaproteobacteria bacterium]
MKYFASIFFAIAFACGAYAPEAQAKKFDLKKAQKKCAKLIIESCEKGKKGKNNKKCKKDSEKLPDCNENMNPYTLCKLDLKKVVPTQTVVGIHAATCKKDKLRKKAKEGSLQSYLSQKKRHVPVIIGPAANECSDKSADRSFYITDRHHLSYAMHLLPKKYSNENHIVACILAKRSKNKPEKFWKFMDENKLAWRNDAKGEEITLKKLQKEAACGLAGLERHPYRTWSRWVRESCGYLKEGKDCVPDAYSASQAFFMEFKWADYMRKNLKKKLKGKDIDLENINSLSDDKIKEVLNVAIDLVQDEQAKGLPGYHNGEEIKADLINIEGKCEKKKKKKD